MIGDESFSWDDLGRDIMEFDCELAGGCGMSEVEDAIRVWEVARIAKEKAMSIWETVCSAPDTTWTVKEMAGRALEAAEDWEIETRRKVVCLMPLGVGEGRTYEKAEGLIVDGRFYLRFGDTEIRSIGIASNVSKGTIDE